MQKYKNAIACAAAIGLLLTRIIYYVVEVRRYTTENAEPFYIFLRYGIAAIAIWQAVRLFLADKAILIALTLCAVAIIVNPFHDVHFDEDEYATLYAIMTLPFIAAAVEDILYVRKAKKEQ